MQFDEGAVPSAFLLYVQEALLLGAPRQRLEQHLHGELFEALEWVALDEEAVALSVELQGGSETGLHDARAPRRRRLLPPDERHAVQRPHRLDPTALKMLADIPLPNVAASGTPGGGGCAPATG